MPEKSKSESSEKSKSTASSDAVTKKKKSGKIWKIIVLILVVIIIVAGVLFILQYQQTKKQIDYLSSPDSRKEMNEKDIERLLEKVRKHMLLPEEEPMIATITDVEALKKDQSFYKDAKNGDKVIIFSTKAILYDVENDIIVNVGPVYMKNQDQGQNTNPEEEEENKTEVLTIEVRNGSMVVGSARALGDNLDAMEEYEVITVDNAVNSEYAQTVIINLSDKDVSALEKEIGVTAITTLPADEVDSRADVLIIIGND